VVKLIVDASQFIHANWYICVKYEWDVIERVVDNIENEIFKLEQQAHIGSVVLALDSKPIFRTDIDPMYKNKPSSGIPIHEITSALIDRFQTLKCSGMEADDIIYLYCARHTTSHQVIILSSDKDHMQTVEKTNAIQWCIRKGHIPNDGSWKYKIYLGCDSDGVPKSLAPRVGEKALLKVFPDVSSLKIDEERLNLNKHLIEYSRELYEKHIPSADLFVLDQHIENR